MSNTGNTSIMTSSEQDWADDVAASIVRVYHTSFSSYNMAYHIAAALRAERATAEARGRAAGIAAAAQAIEERQRVVGAREAMTLGDAVAVVRARGGQA